MNKKIIISVSIIAVLMLYVIIANVKHSPDTPDLPAIDAKADEILINREAGVIRLYLKEGKWVTGDKAFPADAKQVEEIEKRFKEVRLTDLISSKGYYSRYDLTPDKYVEVILKKDEANLRRFKIGKKGPTNRHTFVKIRRDAVSAFTVEHRGMVFAFTRTKDAKGGDTKGAKKDAKKPQEPAWGPWTCRGYEAVKLNDAMVDNLLQALEPLRASSFPDMPKEALAQKVCTVQVKAFDKDIVLTVYRNNGTYAAVASDCPYVFEVDRYLVERFFLTGIDKFKAAAK